MKGRIGPLQLGRAVRMAEAAVLQAAARRRDEAARSELEAGVLDAKGWNALGAFDPTERAADNAGFHHLFALL